MTPIPDINTYADLGALAPDPDDGTCDWCDDWYCPPDCRPPRDPGPAGPQGGEHYIDWELRNGDDQ